MFWDQRGPFKCILSNFCCKIETLFGEAGHSLQLYKKGLSNAVAFWYSEILQKSQGKPPETASIRDPDSKLSFLILCKYERID